MRASTLPVAAALAAACSGLTTVPAAAAPAACGGVPQITDATGDGHHQNTDVTAAWFSEQRGVQAVIRLRDAIFTPAHDDSEAAGFALLFEVDGVRRYVRAEAPRDGAVRYDYGTWTAAGGFVTAGATTGAVEPGRGGAVVIDVPGVGPGTRLSRPFVLTYDGEDAPGVPHWVDRAPGGTAPGGTEFGADLVLGVCGLTAGPAAPGGGPATGATGQPSPGAGPGGELGAVVLRAPGRITGGRTITVSGSVLPAHGGVPVTVRQLTRAGTTVRSTATGPDGAFALRVAVGETSRLRASAGGLDSQTVTVTVRSIVRVRVRPARTGGVLVTGTVSPKLPGRVLWLRDGAASPSAVTTARGGSFRLRLTRPAPGRYQAVFIPSGARAERSTSNTGVIR